MVEAAEKDATSAAQRLGGLIEQSSRFFFPGVGDPLSASLEIGSHRWLAGDREEVYSDWLAWIIGRQDDPARMLSLFGLDGRPGLNEQWAVEREVVTPYGRLDLLLRHEQAGVLCVEVKTESVPGDDQLERYLDWLAGQRSSLGLVLLARDPPLDEALPVACRFCSWKHIALNLRAWASDWLRTERPYDAVMTLAFCGAIERNLLSLGSGGLNALRAADYLEEVLGDPDVKATNR
jgi:hypothetical protein